MKNVRLLASTLLVAALLPLTACEKPPAPQETGGNAASAGLPSDMFLAEAPDAARGVGEVKADADASGPIVVHGRIGGRVEPFVDGAAVFLLTDAEIKTCDELHGDTCPTPWDYCCEPRDSLRANIATVQIVDDAGKPMKLSIKGQHGLKPKAHVTIVGEIDQHDADTLVINARQIYVAPEEA